MNIFVLASQPREAAALHCDQHVVKMCLETAQILCTVLRGLGIDAPYRATHVAHPCTIWAGETLGNYIWTKRLGLALGDEYTLRFGKKHKSHGVIRSLPFPEGLDGVRTPHVLCMPEEFKSDDAIASYRRFYAVKPFKMRWTRRDPPQWLSIQSKECHD